VTEVNIKIGFRDACETDKELLLKIYGSTRTEELAQVTYWDDNQKMAFIQHQYHAQDFHYKKYYPDAQYSIIIYDGKDAGRIYVERNQMPEKIHVIDISILPEFRNNGIATTIFRQLQDEAIQTNKSLSIHVEKFNKAKQLYERLGFVIKSESSDIYVLMEWNN
jgi:ribosomal protein S18 acetylase RimI-like enzyme